ncbi:putative protein phosphatases pp1 regulatory subunit [Planoprotostelium fungivorum]|uniref:AIR9-like A9 domain-containing protein n=1 Tax=Planoprotostelium fungivorum TaxID=1890364 RepID=A0A2P6NIH5_9EUKA|nr:putative protein phosphatases pp1 regulatory subunit [Planoprotostelium fungivorum]
MPGSPQLRATREKLNDLNLRSFEQIDLNRHRLEFLYARGNLISNFNGLGYLPALRVLDVSGNKLTSQSLVGLQASQLPSLRELILNTNDITSTSELDSFPRLEVGSSTRDLNSSVCLQILSLSGNYITSFDGMRLQPQLTVLFMADNRLNSLKGLNNLPKLESVRITNNPIQDTSITLLMRESGTHSQIQITSSELSCFICCSNLRKINGKGTAVSLRLKTETSHVMKIFLNRCIPLCTKYSIQTGFSVPKEWFFDIGSLRGHQVEIDLDSTDTARATSTLLGESQTEVDPDQLTIDHCNRYMMDGSDERLKSLVIEGQTTEQQVLTAIAVWKIEEAPMYHFRWYASDTEGNFEEKHVADGETIRLEYQHIDRSLRLDLLLRGDDGWYIDISLFTPCISSLLPSVQQVDLVGPAREDQRLTVSYRYVGGREGDTKFEWYRSVSPLDENSVDAEKYKLENCGNGLTLGFEDADKVISVRVTPVRADGTIGKPSWSHSSIVRPSVPAFIHLGVSGRHQEGELLRAEGVYTGGPPGMHRYAWYRSTPRDICTCPKPAGTPPPSPKMRSIRGMRGIGMCECWGSGDASQLGFLAPVTEGKTSDSFVEYCPSYDDIGHLLVFQFVPFDARGVCGKSQLCVTSSVITPGLPRLLPGSASMNGNAAEGSRLKLTWIYFGGSPSPPIISWYKKRASFTPSEEESLRGGYVQRVNAVELSETTDELLLSDDEVGHVIIATITPQREDGTKGPVVLLRMNGLVTPSPPECTHLQVLGECVEGEEMIVRATYRGGQQGESLIHWYRQAERVELRYKEDFEEDEYGLWRKIRENDGNRVYFPVALDVGRTLRIKYTPMREDGLMGRPSVVVTPIIHQGKPKVSQVHVRIIRSEEGTPLLEGCGTYQGGKEGKSEYKWKVSYSLQSLSTAPTITTALPFFHYRGDTKSFVQFFYTPVRWDGVAGSSQSSDAFDLARLHYKEPKLENATIEGVMMQSHKIKVCGDYRDCSVDTCVYQWYRRSATVSNHPEGPQDAGFTLITGANEHEYTLTPADVSCEMRCIISPRHNQWSELTGDPITITSKDAVETDWPKLESVTVIGSPHHNNTLVAKIRWAGGIPRGGKVHCLWNRVDSSLKRSSTGVKKNVFTCDVDDIGYCLSVLCVPFDLEGKKGDPLESPKTTVVKVCPAITPPLEAFQLAGVAVFQVEWLREEERVKGEVVVELDRCIIRTREEEVESFAFIRHPRAIRVKVEEEWRIQISVVNGASITVVPEAEECDLLVLTIRSFLAKFLDSLW